MFNSHVLAFRTERVRAILNVLQYVNDASHRAMLESEYEDACAKRAEEYVLQAASHAWVF